MFSLDSYPDSTKLIISYVGFISDTLTVRGTQRIVHVLKSNESNDLDEIIVSQRKNRVSCHFFQHKMY